MPKFLVKLIYSNIVDAIDENEAKNKVWDIVLLELARRSIHDFASGLADIIETEVIKID